MREAIERLFERQSAVVGEALKAAVTASGSADSPTPPPGPEAIPAAEPLPPPRPRGPAPDSPRLQALRAKQQRRVERFEQVHERRRQGHSVRRIARELDLSRNAVRRYLLCEECPDWRPERTGSSRLDVHREWIDARLAEGCTNAAGLHRGLAARGFRGSSATVQRYVTLRPD